MSPIIISVDGNIGSGKSTLIEVLKCHYKGDLVILEEPVNTWTNITDEKSNEDIITKFYKNKKAHSFSFQMLALITRFQKIKKIIKENPDVIIITERSIMSDREVFCKMMYDEDNITDIEYKIYLQCFNEFIDELPVSGVIYLQTDPHICYRRILTRNRRGEEVDTSYLLKCAKYHDNWLKSSKNMFIKLNGDDNIFKNSIVVRKWIKDISNFLTTFSRDESEKKMFNFYKNFPYERYVKEILSNRDNYED